MEKFYNECANILDIPHVYRQPIKLSGKKGRWVRTPGNGRFPGFGIIRYYSSNLIHCMTRKGIRTFHSEQEVLDWLRR